MARDDSRRQRGAVLPLFAGSLVTLLIATAFSVDLGREMVRARQLQSVADIAAIEAAREVDGRTVADLRPDVEAAVADAAARNGESSADYEIQYGVYDLVLREFHESQSESSVPNAIRVEPTDEVEYYFIPGSSSTSRDAVALQVGVRPECAVPDPACTPPFCPAGDPACAPAICVPGDPACPIPASQPRVDIGIGSIGFALEQQLDPVNGNDHVEAFVQALNARLQSAFDDGPTVPVPTGDVDLMALSYRGLAASDVSVALLAAAAGFASPEELANANLTGDQLFDAAITSLQAEGNNVAAGHLQTIASSLTFANTGTMVLGDGPLGFAQGTGTAEDPGAARARINVMDLLVGGASLVDNRNFASLQFDPVVPGVLSVGVDTRIVESEQWVYSAPIGAQVQTAQIRQQLTISIDGDALGIPGLSAPIDLPVVVEGATAQADLTRIDCTDPIETSEADLLAQSSLARTTIGVAQNLQAAGNPALTISVAAMLESGEFSLSTLLFLGVDGLVFSLTNDINGSSTASLGGQGPNTHTFLPAATPNPPQRVGDGVRPADVGTTLQAGFTSNLPAVGASNLATSLSSVFTDIGGQIIDPLLHAYGVTLAGADLYAQNLNCSAPILVE